MKTVLFNNIDFFSDMSLYEIRKLLLDYYDKLLSDKVRVFSLVYKGSKYVSEKLGIPFEGYFLAIGEINHKSFSGYVQDEGGFIQGTKVYNGIIDRKKIILKDFDDEGISQFQYDLTGAGYNKLRKLLSKQEFNRTGISFDYNDNNNEIFVVNGASFGLKSVFEMFYRKLGKKVKTIFPVPMFAPVLHASDIFLDAIIVETKEENQFKITKEDINNIIKTGKQIELFYLCLLNNPTSISYTSDEVENILTILFNYNKDLQVIIDGVYIAGGNIEQIHNIFSMIEKKGWINNIILIDGEGKAKARTGKRSGSIYLKDRENINILSNILRNSTGGISSDLMIETISVIEELDINFSQIIYEEISSRRERFIKYMFENEDINKYLVDISGQYGLKNGLNWKGGLYAFIKLKDNVDVTEFILNTGIIGTPGRVFGSEKYNNYIRLSFGYESY